MKKSVLLFVLVLPLILTISHAVPDADSDGVPDEDDRCPNSDTTIVDQFGCACSQKNCVADDNPCTDDCRAINGIAVCRYINNDANSCPNGKCFAGKCDSSTIITVNGEYISFIDFPKWFFDES